jgi:hypothetical protein
MEATSLADTSAWDDAFVVPNDRGKKKYLYREKNTGGDKSGSQNGVKIRRIRKRPKHIQKNDVSKTTVPFMAEAKSMVGPEPGLHAINHFNGEPQLYSSVPKVIHPAREAQAQPPSPSSPADESDESGSEESDGGDNGSLSGGSEDDSSEQDEYETEMETEDEEPRSNTNPSSPVSTMKWLMEDDRKILLTCRSTKDFDEALSELTGAIPNRSLPEVNSLFALSILHLELVELQVV